MNAEDQGFLPGGNRPLKVAVIGLSQCPPLLDDLRGLPVEVVGVADLDLTHPALDKARKIGLFVSQDYTVVLERIVPDLVLNLSPDPTVQGVIEQLRDDRTQVVHAATGSLLGALLREFIVGRSLGAILDHASGFFSGYLDQDSAVRGILRGVMRLPGVRATGLWLKRGKDFVLLHGQQLPQPLVAYSPREGAAGPLDRLGEERRPVWIPNVESEASAEAKKPFLDAGLRGLLMLPLIRDLEVRGALILFAEGDPPEDLHGLTRWMQPVSEILGQILEREGTLGGAREFLIRDDLTGLYNDVYLKDRLREEVQRTNRNGSPFSVIYISTSAGPGGKPEVQRMIRPLLRAVGARLTGSLRNVDIPARYKDADFVVILPASTATEAAGVGRRLVQHLSAVPVPGVGERAVECGIGVASYPVHGAQPAELLDNAQWAAVRARRQGANRVVLFQGAGGGLEELTPQAIIHQCPALSEIFRLLEVTRADDKGAYAHAQGVAHYAGLIGRTLGLSAEEMFQLRLAGWLHDIGKMTLLGLKGGIPNRFPGLAELDRKLHAPIGAYILKNLLRAPTVLKGVFYHHARFDGAGYPFGIRGEEIPREGRIIAVANAYQHLHAVGGSPLANQRALIQLRKMGRTQLDPQIVECLVRGVSMDPFPLTQDFSASGGDRVSALHESESDSRTEGRPREMFQERGRALVAQN